MMGAHETRGQSDDWLTPHYIFEALGCGFDMDVAAAPRSYVPATWLVAEKSLEIDWTGFVWMNPPFGHQSTKIAWLTKFFDHGNGIALLPDRTSAPWFQQFAPLADLILFVSPKIKFERPDGTIGEQPGTGTALMGIGSQARVALRRAAPKLGMLVTP